MGLVRMTEMCNDTFDFLDTLINPFRLQNECVLKGAQAINSQL